MILHRLFLGIILAIICSAWLISSEASAEEPTPDVGAEPSTGALLIGGILGYTLGPLLLFYGFKVKELLVVLNSLISSGINSFIETAAYIETLNADISGGRLLPEQLGALLSILLGAFTLAAAALKIKKLNTAMKGGVVANLVFSIVADQIPPQYGCYCVIDELDEPLKCSPLVNWPAYIVEPRCYEDRWLRFWIKYCCILFFSSMATKAANFVDRLNSSIVAANLINEAIYDTALAVLPDQSSRVQPYRMSTLLMMTSIGIFVQEILEHIENPETGDPHTYCLGCFKFFDRVSGVLMSPLMLVNNFVKSLVTMGEQKVSGLQV
jgi:hypothetical protein